MFALVDCNNFYVSCERVFDLSLVGKPVATLSNNDGCVISRSNELKTLGVKMGVPYYQLKPYIARYGIAVRSSNYELYGDMSRRVMTVLADFAPEVEPYSIDEAFLHLSLPETADYFAYGKQIRHKVMKWIGIPVGVGIAPTRTLAKIANHIGKKSPDGVFVMPNDPTLILDQLPVEEVWGIGYRLAEKLNRIGIRTAEQLRQQDDTVIRKKFNVCVARTVMELNGTSALETDNVEEPSQSISCSRSFGHPVVNLNDLSEAVCSYIATAATKLRGENQKASGVNIYFQYYPEYGNQEQSGGTTGTTVVFDAPTADTGAMLNKISNALPSIFIDERRYKKAGVIFFGLESAADVQPDIFTPAGPSKSDKLYEAIDRINQQFGKKAIFHAGEGIDRPWAMKRDHLSPCYTTNWNQLPEVK